MLSEVVTSHVITILSSIHPNVFRTNPSSHQLLKKIYVLVKDNVIEAIDGETKTNGARVVEYFLTCLRCCGQVLCPVHLVEILPVGLLAFSTVLVYARCGYMGDCVNYVFDNIIGIFQFIMNCELHLSEIAPKSSFIIFCKATSDFIEANKEHIFNCKMPSLVSVLNIVFHRIYRYCPIIMFSSTTIIRAFFAVFRIQGDRLTHHCFSTYLTKLINELINVCRENNLPTDIADIDASAVRFFNLDANPSVINLQNSQRIYIVIELIYVFMTLFNDNPTTNDLIIMEDLLKYSLALMGLIFFLWTDGARNYIHPVNWKAMVDMSDIKKYILPFKDEDDYADLFYPRQCLHRLFLIVFLVDHKLPSLSPKLESSIPALVTLSAQIPLFDRSIFTCDLLETLFHKYSLTGHQFSFIIADLFFTSNVKSLIAQQFFPCSDSVANDNFYYEFVKVFLNFQNDVILAKHEPHPVDDLSRLFNLCVNVTNNNVKSKVEIVTISPVANQFLNKNLCDVIQFTFDILDYYHCNYRTVRAMCFDLLENIYMNANCGGIQACGYLLIVPSPVTRISPLYNESTKKEKNRMETICLIYFERFDADRAGKIIHMSKLERTKFAEQTILLN